MPNNVTVMDHEPMMERLLTYEQAAKLLGVTARTVWTLVNRRELRATHIGRSVRIDPADLRAFIQRGKVQCAGACDSEGVDHG